MTMLKVTHTVGLRATLPQHGGAISRCPSRIVTGKPQLTSATQVVVEQLPLHRLITFTRWCDEVLAHDHSLKGGGRIATTSTTITLIKDSLEIIAVLDITLRIG